MHCNKLTEPFISSFVRTILRRKKGIPDVYLMLMGKKGGMFLITNISQVSLCFLGRSIVISQLKWKICSYQQVCKAFVSTENQYGWYFVFLSYKFISAVVASTRETLLNVFAFLQHILIYSSQYRKRDGTDITTILKDLLNMSTKYSITVNTPVLLPVRGSKEW